MSGRREVSGAIMQRLRRCIPAPGYTKGGGWSGIIRTRFASQEDVARLLGASRRAVQGWEAKGAPAVAAWAMVGVAFRFRTADRALLELAQSDLPGAAAWGVVLHPDDIQGAP